MSDRHSPKGTDVGRGGVLAVLGAVLLAVVCCAGPVLLAGGGLAVAGGLLGNPLVLTLGGLALAGAVAYGLHRRARMRSRATAGASELTGPAASAAGDCCAAPQAPGKPLGEQGQAQPAQERGDRA